MTTGMIIDSDAHVIETEATWEYLEAGHRKYRPKLFANEELGQEYWVIDDKICGFRFKTPSEKYTSRYVNVNASAAAERNPAVPAEASELRDVDVRLRHMDELGIDVQVLYNTLWVVPVAERPEVEIALCRSWNRWLADVWKRGGGRLRWCCVIPADNIAESIDQIRFAKV